MALSNIESGMPFDTLTLVNLPEEWRNPEILSLILETGKLVVRLKVKTDSDEEEFGCGHVVKYGGQYVVQTRNDILKDIACATGCEILFDCDNEEGDVITCMGTGIMTTPETRGLTLIQFEPIPEFLKDIDFIDEKYFLPDIEITQEDGNSVKSATLMMMSYSESRFFAFIPGDMNLNKMADHKITFCDGTVSSLASYWITFEPIPDKLKVNPQHSEYSSCQVLVSTDDDVFTVGATTEFACGQIVLKLPCAVTSMEAKDCVIYFYCDNDSECFGTGICFMESDLGSITQLDLDLKFDMDTGRVVPESEIQMRIFDSFWLLPISPVTAPLQRYLKRKQSVRKILGADSRGVVVFGHPEGRRKMAATGQSSRSGIYHNKETGDVGFEVTYKTRTEVDLGDSVLLSLPSGRVYHGDVSSNKQDNNSTNRAVLGVLLNDVLTNNK